ncbi:EthD domain-containing protein [Sphingomonas profundi]|uniref:EthD domain-containing protein n=1 Tax=Alterirhizorhabdus profundi TaxID=2681549 RepID=UPI0012E7C349|nr:EthD domain-containing protein [Sphingomonas profundi]
MFKTITLLKRRPGLTMAEFIDYYETRHRVIGEKYLRGSATRYVRRFLHSFPNPLTGEVIEPEHDVVMEIWFPDRETFETTMASLAAPEIAAEISEDEERVFDRAKNRMFTVEEHESDLG